MPNDMGPVTVSFPSKSNPYPDEQRSPHISARSTLQMHLKAHLCATLSIEKNTPIFKGNDLVPIRSITCADGNHQHLIIIMGKVIVGDNNTCFDIITPPRSISRDRSPGGDVRCGDVTCSNITGIEGIFRQRQHL